MNATLGAAAAGFAVGVGLAVGVGEAVGLEVGADDAETVAEIAVTDQGIGMDPETAAHTFDQFYRADRARALVPDGSGIGLYAVRGVVEAMGGSVRVRTRPDAGTTLVLILPAEATEAAVTPV